MIFHLPMLLGSSIKYQSKLPESLLVDGQCLDRVIFCPKPFDFNDLSLKLAKYLMFPKSHSCVKIRNGTSRKHKATVCNTSVHQCAVCFV